MLYNGIHSNPLLFQGSCHTTIGTTLSDQRQNTPLFRIVLAGFATKLG
jgi:hypothetical protein